MKKLDQKELINKYLHGELSEDVRENLEEQFFLDEGVYEEIETEEMTLVDRYVRNGMDEAEKRRFEKSFLTTLERKKKVAESRMFHTELEKLEPEKQRWLVSFSALFAAFRLPTVQLATAAVLIIGFGLFWIQFSIQPVEIAYNGVEPIDTPPVNINPYIDLVPGNNSPEAPPKPPVNSYPPKGNRIPDGERPPSPPAPPSKTILATLIPTFAGAIAIPRTVRSVPLTIKKDTAALNLQLPLPAEVEAERFSFVIENADGAKISSANSVKPRQTAKGRSLSVRLKTISLAEGKYTVTVNPSGSQENTVIYGFTLEKQ